ncbi:hypothetical protein L914_08025 [Phytophthora nicotianae]|uniref:Uncharacterized protein n=1 Tax=Phytophthora nicotianae TaxID=4792 RepID=W2NHT7_PHYNI|nr:hypothetical protein L914_08025 [Phytophthora nicotianae]
MRSTLIASSVDPELALGGNLSFNRPIEAGAWYPGADPADLLEALAITNTADRWHNHYRDVPGDHPALGIARLPGKFVPSSS